MLLLPISRARHITGNDFLFFPLFPSCYFRGMIVLLVSFFRSRDTPVSITVSVVVPSYNINNLFCPQTFISRVKSEISRVWTSELNHIASQNKAGKRYVSEFSTLDDPYALVRKTLFWRFVTGGYLQTQKFRSILGPYG